MSVGSSSDENEVDLEGLRRNLVTHQSHWLRQIVCALRKAQFPAATGVLSRLSLHPRAPRISPGGTRVYIRMAEPGRFHDAALVRIRQPDRTGGAALPVVRGKGRELILDIVQDKHCAVA